MLDQFVDEPLRNGHFTHFWAPGITPNNGLAAREVDRPPALLEDRQVVEAPRTDHGPASTLVQEVAKEGGREQDIAHIGAWAKEWPTRLEMEAVHLAA
jgi:hypothetical protein